MTHWTVSRLKDFETCPAKYDYAYNKKVPGIEAPAASRGTQIHEQIEKFLLGTLDSLPPVITPAWAHQIELLRDIKATPEQAWEFTDGWHARQVGEDLWLRGKIDAHYRMPNGVVRVIDFKTGKPYRANMEQVEVYALMAFSMYDEAQAVLGELWYLDHEEPHDKTFKRESAAKLAKKWEQRAGRLTGATIFPFRPGNHCGWCAFRKICPEAA
jgi:CRISPR/Cas system-associated exonuclease Cas4 (RecB family)